MKYRRLLCLALAIVLCMPIFSACTGKEAPNGDSVPFTSDVTGGYTLSGGAYVAARLGGVPAELAAAKIKPLGDAPADALPTDAALVLTAAGAVDEATVRRYVSISPAVDYELEALSDTEFKITPLGGLDSGAVYSVDIGAEGKPAALRYAFQTEREFKIKWTLPTDRSFDVPVNTGIELHFTEPVSGNNFKDFVKIEPAVEFDVLPYPNGKTVALVPKSYLEKNTVYTVTISGGLESATGKTLGEDVKFQFRTEAKPSVTADGRVQISPESYDLVFATSQTPVFKWWVFAYDGQEIKEGDAEVKIWRYPSVRALAEAVKKMNESRGDVYFSGEGYRYPTDGLEKVAEYSAAPAVLEDSLYSRRRYVELRTPGRGVYLCEVTLTASSSGEPVTRTFQAIVQVTDLRLYTESHENKLLLWLEGAGGLDASYANITAELFKDKGQNYWNIDPAAAEYKTVTAKADGYGIATIDVGGANFAYIIAEKGEDALFRYASLYDIKYAKEYFATVFTDREVYFADDVINFRGFMRPARGGEMPKRIYVTTGTNTKFSLPVAPDGSFAGSYILEDFYGWGVSFSFADEAGNTITYKTVRVTQEEKPVYTAHITFDRPAYNFGEEATVTIDAAFFDGTPAPGLKFELSFSDFSGPVMLVTDSEGKAEYRLKTGKVNVFSTYPHYISCSAQLMGYEGTTLHVYASALYFHSDVYFSYKTVETDEGERYIIVTLNRFDQKKIAAIKSVDELYGEGFPEKLFAGPAEGSVTVTLAETWFDEIETGTVYDPINKKTTKTYRYEKRDKVLRTWDESFKDGQIRLDYVDAQSEHYTYYTVSYRDSRGNTYNLTINAQAGNDEWYIYRGQGGKYYELSYDSSPKSVGDKVELVLTYGGEPVKGGRALFTVYTDKLERHAVTAGGFSLEFEESFIAGNQIYATYFDGTDFAYIGSAFLQYDYVKNSSLELEIITDKDTYKPGEKATVTVRVIDKLTGKPVTGGTVTLAVVDEACFALGEQSYDPAAEYYGYLRAIPYISRNAAVSLFPVGGIAYDTALGGIGGPAAEEKAVGGPRAMGGDNMLAADEAAMDGTASAKNAQIREIFLNTPVFETKIASADGTATFTFDVPGNITTWRLTAVAESEVLAKAGGVKLGAAKSEAIATLPFFVSAYANSRYIFGDEIVVSARVYGTGLEPGALVEYIATLADAAGNTIKSIEKSAAAGMQVFFSFGKLGLGGYTVTVAAASGGYSDGVKIPFEVIETGVLVPVYRTIKPSEIDSLNPSAYPITLTFYNAATEDWLLVANYVIQRRGLRADTLAAYYAVGKALSEFYGGGEYFEKLLDEAKEKLSSYGNHYGNPLIPLLPYSSEGIELSALILAAAPEALGESRRESIAGYLEELLERGIEDETELSALYLGLAAAGRPVLTELRYLAEHCGEMPLIPQLYICAALAEIGDYGSAAELYAQIRKKYASAGEDGTLWFAEPDANAEDRIAGAAAALLSASHIARDDADALAKFIMSRTSEIELYVLQLAEYVCAFIPADGGELALEYMTADGERHSEKVSPYGWVCLTLDKQSFQGFKLISADDGIMVRASYMGSPEEAVEGAKPTEEASLKKTISVYDEARGLYKVTIEYKITTDRDRSFFVLTDLIPSGGRFFYAEPNEYHEAYIYNDGQTMRGGIYVDTVGKIDKSLPGKRTRTVTGKLSYIFRAAVPGEYVAEPAFMQNAASGCYAASAKGTITLK